MIVFALLVSSLVLLGTLAAHALWSRLDPAGLEDTAATELVSAGALLGITGWLAANWVLALTHTLRAPALWSSVIAVFAATAAVVARRGKQWSRTQVSHEAAAWLIFLIPMAFWLVYILWRGLVLPPASHDVLAYHLPKAVMLERAAGWEVFEAPDWRITKYPFNYELLLADMLILGGSDRYTEWIGAVSYLLLLLIGAAFARRWWRASVPATVAVVLAAGSAPVLLLHSGAHKNDLLVAWLSACALLWGTRWVTRGGRMAMLLLILSLGLGLGTKTTIVAVGAGLAPFLAYRSVRELRRRVLSLRDVAAAGAVGLMSLVFSGGFTYLVTLVRLPGASDLGRATTTATQLTHIAWGDWSNLWQVPYLLLTVPFSSNPEGVWVPWSGQMWFWPHYEIYFSHYGRLISLLLLALPFVLWKLGGRAGGPARAEWKVLGGASLIAIALMLPTVFRPAGFFGAMARYLAFIVPIVAALTIPPLIDGLLDRSMRVARLALAGVAVVFSVEAAVCGAHDRFAPLEYALWAAQHPGTRFVYFYPYRAGSVVDRLAGPSDTIAVDGAFDTWVYPAYGANRTRPVVFLPADATPDTIPAPARWVIVDRSWNALWSNPRFENLGQMWQFIGRGKATDEDTRLLRALVRDPRFRLVYRNDTVNQAVFRRVRP